MKFTIRGGSVLRWCLLADVIILLLSVSVPQAAYAVGKDVYIPMPVPDANKPAKPKPKSGRTGKPASQKPASQKPVSKPKITFDESTNTLNCDGWQYQFVVVEGSKFEMGSVPGKPGTDAMGSKAHRVNLETFAIGDFEVPRWLWKAVMGTDPYETGVVMEDDMGAPVNNVSWNDCRTFISKLNKMTGKTFDLPTEAQWEYAARGGINNEGTIYSGTDDKTKLPAVPNTLGIYSMSGLMKEWCADWYADWRSGAEQPGGCVLNPTGGASGDMKVVRGGSNMDYSLMEVTSRECYAPATTSKDIGLRLVLQLVK